MNTLVLEIGNYNIRAIIHTERETKIAHIGTYDMPCFIPSICTKLSDGKFVWGREAEFWKMYDGCSTYSLHELEALPDYENGVKDLIAGIITKISQKIESLVFVIPAYWSANEPKKSCLESSALANGILNVSFIETPIAICNNIANFRNQEYALCYDAGYIGTTISLLKREESRIILIDSILCNDIGGGAMNQILLQKIGGISIGRIDDIVYQMMLVSSLEHKVSWAKEKLSNEAICEIPLLSEQKSVKISQIDWKSLITPAISKSLQICRNLISDNIGNQKISTILLCGGTAKIPFISEKLLQYVQMELNPDVHLVDGTILNEPQFLAVYGAPIQNNRITLKFN